MHGRPDQLVFHNRSRAVGLVLAFGATGCGSEAVGTTTAANRAPVAVIGVESPAIAVGETITVDGSKSYDPDGTGKLAYDRALAAIPDGSAAVLVGAGGETVTFEADVGGRYVVLLAVSDGLAWSQPVVQALTADIVNAPPVAVVAASQIVLPVGATATLDGTGSHDPDYWPGPLGFSWTLTDQPPGSGAKLADATLPEATLSPDLPGQYTVELVVSDGAAESSPATSSRGA